MPAKKNSVTTPLHLLQQLSHSLVAHLQKACGEAQKDAEILLAKLEKQRGKAQEKVVKARAKLDDSGNAGKSKAQAKARARLAELDDMLAVLQARQNETLNYLSELKRDAQQSLQLAQGVSQVEKAAAEALASRDKAGSRAAPKGKTTSGLVKSVADVTAAGSKLESGTAPSRAVRPAAGRARPSAANSTAAAKTAEAKAPAAKAPTAPRRPARTSGAPAATKATPAPAKSAPAKKPAARKPAAAKREVGAQLPSSEG